MNVLLISDCNSVYIIYNYNGLSVKGKFMNKKKLYRFSDFTLKNYKSILQLGLENYKFEFFNVKIAYKIKVNFFK